MLGEYGIIERVGRCWEGIEMLPEAIRMPLAVTASRYQNAISCHCQELSECH